MKELLAAAIVVIVIAMAAFIGLGVTEKTYDTVKGQITNTTTLDSFKGSINDTFSTLGGMLPIVVMALVGGLAIYFVIRYIGGHHE
jgi:Na+/proline symporter